MQLTYLSDYALRTLMFVAVKENPSSLSEIAAAYGISRNHLVKAVGLLEKNNFLTTKRGRGGGISLARPPAEINIAEVISCTEPGFDIVECFNKEKNTCKLVAHCRLKTLLARAKDAFMQELAGYSLADITSNAADLAGELGLSSRP